MNDPLKKMNEWFEKLRTSQISYDKNGIRPLKDWKIIMTSMFIVLLIIIAIATYFYMEVDGGKFFSVEEGTIGNETKINDNLLKKTLEGLNSRQEKLTILERDRIAPLDPSI